MQQNHITTCFSCPDNFPGVGFVEFSSLFELRHISYEVPKFEYPIMLKLNIHGNTQCICLNLVEVRIQEKKVHLYAEFDFCCILCLVMCMV